MSLEALLQRGDIWRAGDYPDRVNPALSCGYPALDRCLAGGWPRGVLTEMLATEGLGLRLLLPALADLTQQGRWVMFANPPYIPYAPALHQAGVLPEQVLWLRHVNDSDMVWAVEQGLHNIACAAVLMWLRTTPADRWLRRLQLAAEAGASWLWLWRDAQSARQSSPAALRIAIDANFGGGLRVQVLKRRGTFSAQPIELEIAA